MIRPLSRTALILDIVGAALLFLVLTPTSVVFYGPSTGGGVIQGASIGAVVVAAVLAYEVWFLFFSGSPFDQRTGRH